MIVHAQDVPLGNAFGQSRKRSGQRSSRLIPYEQMGGLVEKVEPQEGILVADLLFFLVTLAFFPLAFAFVLAFSLALLPCMSL